jgi:hypothetical protein
MASKAQAFVTRCPYLLLCISIRLSLLGSFRHPRFNLQTDLSPAFPLDLGVLRSDPRPEQAATAFVEIAEGSGI